jgi:hypothetical protein
MRPWVIAFIGGSSSEWRGGIEEALSPPSSDDARSSSYYNGMEGLGKDPGPDEVDGFDMRKSMTRDVVSRFVWQHLRRLADGVLW